MDYKQQLSTFTDPLASAEERAETYEALRDDNQTKNPSILGSAVGGVGGALAGLAVGVPVARLTGKLLGDTINKGANSGLRKLDSGVADYAKAESKRLEDEGMDFAAALARAPFEGFIRRDNIQERLSELLATNKITKEQYKKTQDALGRSAQRKLGGKLEHGGEAVLRALGISDEVAKTESQLGRGVIKEGLFQTAGMLPRAIKGFGQEMKKTGRINETAADLIGVIGGVGTAGLAGLPMGRDYLGQKLGTELEGTADAQAALDMLNDPSTPSEQKQVLAAKLQNHFQQREAQQGSGGLAALGTMAAMAPIGMVFSNPAIREGAMRLAHKYPKTSGLTANTDAGKELLFETAGDTVVGAPAGAAASAGIMYGTSDQDKYVNPFSY